MRTPTARSLVLWLIGGLPLLLVCGCGDAPAEALGVARSPLPAPTQAFCTAVVTGVGSIDTENDYLPHVVNCENGGAGLEALKAQAIAARSVLYYAMGDSGSICDGQSCQVYSCGKTPSPLHRQAVAETSGVYLAYNGNLTYAAYRAGDPATAPPSCVGGASETSAITYNEGKSGTAVEQTTSLWVYDPGDSGYGTNRGCMSQNGGACLEDSLGYDYRQILQFYFGADIGMPQALGACVLPLPGEGGGGGGVGGAGEGASSVGAGGASVGGAAPGGAPVGGVGGGGAGGFDEGTGAGALAGVPADGEGDSCGCRAAGIPSERVPWRVASLGLVLAAAVLRRRRRGAQPIC